MQHEGREDQPDDGGRDDGWTSRLPRQPIARAVGPHADGLLAARGQADGRRPIQVWEQPYLTALGAGLRALRHDAGLTQADVAWRAGLAERSLRRIEFGERRTRRSTLARLVALLPDATDATAAAELEEALVLAAVRRWPRRATTPSGCRRDAHGVGGGPRAAT